MLIETKNGRWVQAADVTELRHLGKNEHGSRGFLRDGGPAVAFYYSPHDIAEMTRPVVAATPGGGGGSGRRATGRRPGG